MRWWTLSTASVFVHWSIRVALAGREPCVPVTHHCPKEGCCFPLPILGRSSPPSWATRPPKSHWFWHEKGNRSVRLGRGIQWPILGSFPPISIQDTSLQSLWLVNIHWNNCNAREVPPLWGFQLMLALVMGQERAGFNSWGPCARRLWLGCLLLVRVKLIHIKEDQQKIIIFLKRSPTGMKWVEIQAVWWKQFIFQA